MCDDDWYFQNRIANKPTHAIESSVCWNRIGTKFLLKIYIWQTTSQREHIAINQSLFSESSCEVITSGFSRRKMQFLRNIIKGECFVETLSCVTNGGFSLYNAELYWRWCIPTEWGREGYWIMRGLYTRPLRNRHKISEQSFFKGLIGEKIGSLGQGSSGFCYD